MPLLQCYTVFCYSLFSIYFLPVGLPISYVHSFAVIGFLIGQDPHLFFQRCFALTLHISSAVVFSSVCREAAIWPGVPFSDIVAGHVLAFLRYLAFLLALPLLALRPY